MDEPYDPQEALIAAQDTRRQLADRLVTPIWYHPLTGLTVAAICIAIGMPEGTLDRMARLYILMGTVIVNALVAPHLYRRRTGLWMQNTVGPRSRRVFLLGMLPFAALIVAAVANYLLGGSWIVPTGLGLIALVGVTWFGRHYDDVVREELRECDPQ